MLNQSREQLKTLLVRVTRWLLVSLVSLLNQVIRLRPSSGGVACGTSTAFSDDLATIEFIKETYNKVEVEKL